MSKRTCPTCGTEAVTIDSKTEILEQYEDGIGKPDDPRRWSAGPMRRMVPGNTSVTYSPCSHTVLE